MIVPAASDITYYDPNLGTPFSFAFCSNAAGTLTKIFGSAQAQVEEGTPAPSKLETMKLTPISGNQAGKEQIVATRFLAQEYKIKCTWSQASEQAALVLLEAKTKGVLAVIYADGSGQAFGSGGTNASGGRASLAAAGGTLSLAMLSEVVPGPLTASGLRTAELTFITPMPPVTIATGGTALFV